MASQICMKEYPDFRIFLEGRLIDFADPQMAGAQILPRKIGRSSSPSGNFLMNP